MASENGIILMQALFAFQGQNNDELCFEKGDIITITQREEGGWWEGTLKDKTGWFPSNYVKELKIQDSSAKSPILAPVETLSPQHTQQQKIYRNLVLKDVLDTERSHVADMRKLLSTYLTLLQSGDLLSDREYKQLVGNLEEVASTHTLLLTTLEEQYERPAREQRIGGTFLSLAPLVQAANKAYCANHPRAVCMLEKYKDELNSFMECEGAPRPGIMLLTTALSKPFRHLDKYAGMLQEYERHLDEAHPDRGDTQRSLHVYRDLAAACAAIRRQKELELEVVTGQVRGWDGGVSLGSLGDLLRMGSVALTPDNRDRYLVLFPSALVMLAVSPRMSGFIYEGSFQLAELAVTKLTDTEHYKNAFELSGTLSERIVAICQTRDDQQEWVDSLTQQIKTIHGATHFTLPSNKSPPTSSPLVQTPLHSTHFASCLPRASSLATPSDLPLKNGKVSPSKVWSLSCLRPSPPLRPGLSLRDEKRNVKYRRKDDKWYEDDALILRVIEAYCTSGKARHTVNSAFLDSPQVLIAEEEKIIVEEMRGNEVFMEEKSLVDTVYALRDQMATLLREHQSLKREFEAEKQKSRHLRRVLQQHVLVGRDDLMLEVESPP